MKKIIIASAAVAMAAVSQAANLNWSISNVYSPSDSTTRIAAGTGSAYLFCTQNTTNIPQPSDNFDIPVTTLAVVKALLEAGNVSGAVALSTIHQTNNADGGWSGNTGISTAFSSGTFEGFAVIFDATTATAASNYLIASNASSGNEVLSVTFASATGQKSLGFASQKDLSQSAGGWKAVPEPTSGLLMLLGMAGLALRRKRA